MKAIIFDFNGTLFFDSGFHLEAWAKIYRELRGNTEDEPGNDFYCGPRNDVLLQTIAPWLTPEERDQFSRRKEMLYRQICVENPEKVQLVPGAGELLDILKERQVPFILASASIRENVDFYFKQFGLGRWFDRDKCVYDDGTYADKGEMHMEAARRLGVSLSECLVVEDSVSAISHAKANGAGAIVGIGSDWVKQDLFQAGIDHFIHDFTEFKLEWLMPTLN